VSVIRHSFVIRHSSESFTHNSLDMLSDPSLRITCYRLLTAVAVAVVAAKVASVESLADPSRYRPPTPDGFGRPDARFDWPTARPEPMPMFGSNDKSRWATVRALVEEGTYAIGRRENFRSETGYRDTGIIFQNGYGSIDKVMNPDTGEFFSSKPPLFPTLVAGEYWLLHHGLGWSIDRDRWWVVITVLLTVNVLPFAVYLVLVSRLIEDHGTTDFGRLLAFATACFATFVTTFSLTLNNHNPGTYSVLFALYPLLRKRAGDAEPSGGALFLSGLFAGFAVTLELPAASLLAALFVPLLIARPKRALLFFLPGAMIPLLALLACNYAALGRLTPAYSEFGGPWYNYPGSHWAKKGTADARGIDFADEPKEVYAFHLLFGHHGWFSLTPVWLVGAVGIGLLTWRSLPEVKAVVTNPGKGPWPWTLPMHGALAAVLSVVVIGFFILKTNNYGGGTSGPRWLFWLTPLWLLGMLPAADRLGRCSTGQRIGAVLLGLSVLSVFYPAWNPWRQPWIQHFYETMDWVDYDAPPKVPPP
jgi:hypothetical protein